MHRAWPFRRNHINENSWLSYHKYHKSNLVPRTFSSTIFKMAARREKALAKAGLTRYQISKNLLCKKALAKAGLTRYQISKNLLCQGFLPTSRHFENRRGEGPGDEVDHNSYLFLVCPALIAELCMRLYCFFLTTIFLEGIIKNTST